MMANTRAAHPAGRPPATRTPLPDRERPRPGERGFPFAANRIFFFAGLAEVRAKLKAQRMLARARVRIRPAIWPLLKTARSELSGRIAGPAPTQPRPRRGRSCSSPSTPGGGQGGNGAGGGRDQADTSDTPQTLKMLVGIAAGASLLGGFLNIRAYERRRRREAEHGGGAEGDVKLLKGPAFGKPALGGDFTLINQDNKVTRNSDLHGAWALLYFGFTYCPDICPNELTRLQEILSRLDAENRGKDVQPVFITIDPERDGPAQLKDYLADWHPRLIGCMHT